MYRYCKPVLLIVTILILCQTGIQAQGTNQNDWLTWSELPTLPHERGVRGAFVGTSNGALVVAGGSSFNSTKGEVRRKSYYDTIYVLEESKEEQYQWYKAGRLPMPLAHGATVTTPDGILCIGGTNGDQNTNEVYLVKRDAQRGKVKVEKGIPELPSRLSHLSAARLGTKVYVAGGREASPGGRAVRSFLVLDLSKRESTDSLEWKRLPPWPGPARYGATLISQNSGERESLYLFSGSTGKDNSYLRDSYRYDPESPSLEERWQKKADLPRAAHLAPAVSFDQTHILIFGGQVASGVESTLPVDKQDSSSVGGLNEGSSVEGDYADNVLAYHTVTDTWVTAGHMPRAVAGSHAVMFDDKYVIPGGGTAQGINTAEILAGKLTQSIAQSGLGAADYVTITLYLLVLVFIGLYFSGRQETSKNYLLAGKRIPYWAAGISILATQVSSIGFMATPSKTYATNWAYFSGVFAWIIIVPIINKFYIPFFSKLNVTSAYEYLESRFNVVIRLLGSSFYCVFQVVGRMGVVLFLPSLALSSVTDISAPICIVVMGFLATIYTITGGMEAVIWTDVMQTIVLFGGAIFCITEVISELDGGSSQFIQVAFSENKFSLGGTELSYTAAVLWVVLVGNVFNRLGTYSSDQSVVQRYQTTESGEQARRSLWANVVASVPWAIIIYGLGTALFVFYKSQPEKISPTVTADGVVPFFIANNLPVGVSGIVIAGILAASMSSLDSSMHSVATVLVVDFFERFFPNLAGDAEKLKGARWLVGVLGILGTGVALVLALADLMSIWDFFLEYLGLLTGSLAGLFALGIFSERAHGTGALVGVSSSLVLVLYTKFFTDVHFLLYGVVSFLSCLLIGYFSSLFTTGKGRTSGLTVYTISRKVEP